MQLLYIYVDEYANLQNAEFNFGGPYRFSYNKETNELTAEKTEEQIQGFFGEKISNLTAIIGENGVGKTSILGVISKLLNGDPLYKCIMVFRKSLTDITIVVNDHERGYFNPHRIMPKLRGINGQFEVGGFTYRYPQTVFCSAVIDNYGRRGSVDISTTNILLSSNSLQNFRLTEVTTQLNFLHDSKSSSFEYCPKEIEVFLDEGYIEDCIKKISETEIQQEGEKPICDTLMELLDLIDGVIRYTSSKVYSSNFEAKQLIKLKFYKLILVEIVFFTYEIKEVKDYLLGNKLRNQLNDDKFIYGGLNANVSTVNVFIDTIISKISELLNSNLYELFSELMPYISYKLNLKDDENKLGNGKVSQLSYELTLHFIGKIRTYYNELKYINSKVIVGAGVRFVWRGLSSGEEAKLSLFSRIYSTKRRLNPRKFLLFLVDEGESFYHPEWQRGFLHDFLSFLNDEFNEYQVQVIMTSNSPFLVSDIPKDNIVFLKKGEDGQVKVSDLSEHKETFGSNIHLLLADSFFMSEGVMGKFAEQKIDEVIAYMNDEDSSIKNDEEAQRLISFIGEPILRNSLRKQLEAKRTNGNVRDHVDRIKELEDELRKLKGE